MHVLLLEAPGSAVLRMRAEAAVARRGWVVADAAPEADALLVCGAPGPDLAALGGTVWDQLPGPRARATVTDRAELGAALDDVARSLLDTERQRAEARDRPGPAAGWDEQDGEEQDGEEQDGEEQDGEEQDGEEQDHGGMDHGEMDHGEMEMSGPAGTPLAGGWDGDRDGLEMDVLHVRLGGALRHWPAGVVLRCTVSGDVVVEAEVELLDAVPSAARTAVELAAVDCDAAAAVLALAGWHSAARAAVRARDALLTPDAPPDAERAAGEAARLARRVRRSRALRLLVGGLGAGGAAGGDVVEQVAARLDRAHALLTAAAAPVVPSRAPGDLPGLVRGLDLAAVRLLVAAADVHPVTAPRPAGVRGG
ncbi:hypothetical protein [Kineococcus sp. SYSU DK004]|uniref:hypothetical protein n=1 Tax=Kineococcus sp. SYSU DK004 TaxID=3383125 RepID=UPI003D7CF4B3